MVLSTCRGGFPVAAALLLASAVRIDAQPLPTDLPIERFQRVDERLYRGAQPKADGFRRLRDLGVTTIILLRMEPDAVKTY